MEVEEQKLTDTTTMIKFKNRNPVQTDTSIVESDFFVEEFGKTHYRVQLDENIMNLYENDILRLYNYQSDISYDFIFRKFFGAKAGSYVQYTKGESNPNTSTSIGAFPEKGVFAKQAAARGTAFEVSLTRGGDALTGEDLTTAISNIMGLEEVNRVTYNGTIEADKQILSTGLYPTAIVNTNEFQVYTNTFTKKILTGVDLNQAIANAGVLQKVNKVTFSESFTDDNQPLGMHIFPKTQANGATDITANTSFQLEKRDPFEGLVMCNYNVKNNQEIFELDKIFATNDATSEQVFGISKEQDGSPLIIEHPSIGERYERYGISYVNDKIYSDNAVEDNQIITNNIVRYALTGAEANVPFQISNTIGGAAVLESQLSEDVAKLDQLTLSSSSFISSNNADTGRFIATNAAYPQNNVVPSDNSPFQVTDETGNIITGTPLKTLVGQVKGLSLVQEEGQVMSTSARSVGEKFREL